MPFKKIEDILTKYRGVLYRRNINLLPIAVRSPDELSIRIQTLYLEEVLNVFQVFLTMESVEKIQQLFSKHVSLWQEKYGNTELAYLSAPPGDPSAPPRDPTAPDSPANSCCLELFSALFPLAKTLDKILTFDFLRVFFPGVRYVINCEVSVKKLNGAFHVDVSHQLSPVTAEAINQHGVSDLIIKDGVVLCVADLLSLPPSALTSYFALIKEQYPKHYAQLIRHNEGIQDLYHKIAQLNNSITFDQAILKLRGTLSRCGARVTGLDGELSFRHAVMVSGAVHEFTEYLSLFGEEEGVLRACRGAGGTLDDILKELLFNSKQCVELAAGWLEKIQQNSANQEVLQSRPSLSKEKKKALERSIIASFDNELICAAGRNRESYYSPELLEKVIRQIHFNTMEEIIELFQRFESVDMYEKFMRFNEGGLSLLRQGINLELLLLNLDSSQKKYCMSALAKQDIFKFLQSYWELIKRVSSTIEENDQLLLQVWSVYSSREGFEIVNLADVQIVLRLLPETKVYEACQSFLKKFLRNAEAFNQLLIDLTPEICLKVCRIYQELLSTILTAPRYFNQVCLGLNAQQCAAVCLGSKDLLHKMILAWGGVAWKGLGKRLAPECFLAIYRFCHDNGLPILGKTEDLKGVIELYARTDKALGLYDIFSEKFPDLIGTVKDFFDIVGWIAVSDRGEFCKRASAQFITLIDRGESVESVYLLEAVLMEKDMVTLMSCLTVEQARKVFLSLQNLPRVSMCSVLRRINYFHADTADEFFQLALNSERLQGTVRGASDVCTILETLPVNMREKFFHDFVMRDFSLVETSADLIRLFALLPKEKIPDIVFVLALQTMLKSDARMSRILSHLPSEMKKGFYDGFFDKGRLVSDPISDPKKLVMLLKMLPEEKIRDTCIAFREPLSKILSTPEALAFLKMFEYSNLCKTLTTVVCDVFKLDLLSCTPTPEHLNFFIRELLLEASGGGLRMVPKGFFGTIKGALKAVIKGFESFMIVYNASINLPYIRDILRTLEDCFHDLIANTHELISCLKAVTHQPDISRLFLSACLSKISRASDEERRSSWGVPSPRDFDRLMLAAIQDQRDQLYALYCDQLPGCVETIQDLCLVSRRLNTSDKHNFISACRDKLSGLINSINGMDDFFDLFMAVTPETRLFVFQKGMSNLRIPVTIDKSTIEKFHRILATCSVTEFQEIFYAERLVSRLITKTSDVSSLLDVLKISSLDKTKRSASELQKIIFIICQSQWIREHIQTGKIFLLLLSMVPEASYGEIIQELGFNFLIKIFTIDSHFSVDIPLAYPPYGSDLTIDAVKCAVMKFFKPVLLSLFVGQIKSGAYQTECQFQSACGVFNVLFSDTDQCNALRDRFLTLYAEEHCRSGAFRGNSQWPNLRQTRSTGFFGKLMPEPKELPTLVDILDYARKVHKPGDPSTCKTLKILDQLAAQLMAEFISIDRCLSADAMPARAAPDGPG